MATTFVEYTGDGQASKQFTFPSYQESDVKVRVDGVLKTTSTHYNITSYTTTGGGNVVFTSGNIPSSPANIRIYRDTNVDTAKATFTAGSSVKAADLNNNTTQLLYRAQEEQIPNLIHSYDIDDGAIETSKIKADAITGAKIADDQINSEHYVDGSIDTAHIADAQITTAKLAADSVTGAKIADDQINSEHYVDGSIDTAHIADAQITTAKIADGAVTSAKFGANTVTTSAVADLNITTAKIAADAVTNAKIADDSIDSEHYVDGSIDTAHIGNLQVTTAKIAADAVDGTKIADDSINSEHYVDGSIDTAHIADSQITSAKIASNAVTTDKIADGELTTLAGMQSTTASNLASSTALTATTAELNQLDGITLETSITTNSDTRIPTSKAVNDLVLSVTNALGGFVAIANETSFPTTNPDPSNNAGTVVSISQLSTGLAVNSSGVATISNGAGTGNTVTITGFPSNLQSQTLPASSGLQVQTTSTLHTYTFHKQLASAADIQAISATVNSFSNRYRVSASAPTSSLDGGDLWYDTTNSKLMVYSSQNSAWEESSAIGNFFISTISSSSNTGGGSATPNGTAYRFTISNAPPDAQQLLVSVDGVIQKPNSGSSQPSEGYVLVGNDIIFGAAPANGASLFVTVIGSTVGIGTPSNNTVTTAILQNGSVTTAKITDANVTTAKIADANVTTAKIADSNVTTAKIAADAVTDAKLADNAVRTEHIVDSHVSSAKLGANVVTTAKIADGNVTTAKLAADAVTSAKLSDNAVNTEHITDSHVTTAKLNNSAVTTAKITDGNVTTAKIADDAVTAAKLANTSVTAGSYGTASAIPAITVDAQGRITAASTNNVSIPPAVGGSNGVDFNDSIKARFGNSNDLAIFHDGNNSYIQDSGTGNLINQCTDFRVVGYNTGENMIKGNENGSVELYYNNVERVTTKDNGALINGSLEIEGGTVQGNHDATLYVSANNNNDWGVIVDAGSASSGKSEYGLKVVASTGSGYAFGVAQVSGGSHAYGFLIDGDGNVDKSGNILPRGTNAFDLGSTSYRWRNIYTNDLNLSNKGLSNDVDGTWGDWTIQEGESDLFLKNNRSGKKYKFNLTEVS